MKNLHLLLLALLVVGVGFHANAQVTNLKVNGVSANFTAVQGDSLRWEYDLPVGGTANGQIWIDLNGNGAIDTATDKLMFGTFTQTDGQYGSQEKGPGDMDSLVNGKCLLAFANDGLAPAKYILKFTNNGVGQSISGTITALPSPTYTISGKVTPPVSKSALNILVGGQENNGGGIGWWALTNASGNYTINFNASAVGIQWYIQVQDQFPPYSVQPSDTTITLTGSISGLNFTFGAPAAKVVGYVKGEDGHVFANVSLNSYPQYGGNSKNATTDANGFYQFGYTANDISSSLIWETQADNSSDFSPAYFPPQSGPIAIHQGDSSRVDLIAYVADDSITGRVTIDGHAPNSLSFSLYAGTSDSGYINVNSDPTTGNFTFHVTKKIYNYYVGINNSSIPNGYGYNNSSDNAHPGDKNIVMRLVKVAWSSQTSNTNNQLNAISFVNPTTGWVAGSYGTVLKTTDAGAAWTGQTTNTTANINGIYFVNTTTGWIVGNGGVIKKTTNGGNTWTSQNSTTAVDLQGVQFIDGNTGWVAGGCSGAGTVLKTTNGGSSWSSQNPGSGACLFSISFVDANTGWAVGGGGTILATTDGGSSWSSQSPGGCDLHSVSFVNSTTGWAVGGCGYIFATTNGGSDWTPQMSGGCDLYSVCFANSTTGWAVGSCGGTIWATSDGGSTWASQINSANTDLHAVQFVDAKTGWAVGGSVILHDTSGIILSVRENKLSTLPSGFALRQNYPNPFNPTTTIHFSLPKSSYVTLKVYNMLGQEVATLVNGERTAGEYSVEWQSNTFPSGVYFYRLNAGSFSSIKKMILMK